MRYDNFSLLPYGAFNPLLKSMRLHGGKGGDAPDYSAGMAAQAASSERSAAADLEFRKQQYEEAKPRLEQLYDLASKVGTAQADSMTEQNRRADEQEKFWNDNYKNTEIQSVKEANEAGSEADQASEAGRAVADVRQQQQVQADSNARGLRAMGVNPNSGRFAGMQNATGLQAAANSAGAATLARNTSKNKGIALRAGAVATGRGMQNLAGQTAATASGIGSAGVNSANAGANGGLGYAGLVGQGFQNQTNNANNLFNGYANLQGQSNQINNQDSGLGGMVGTIVGAGITRYSDIRLKENIEYLGQENGINMFEFEYVDKPYLPKGRFIGVIAQDVEYRHPEAVYTCEDGYKRVDYSKIGVEMRAA